MPREHGVTRPFKVQQAICDYVCLTRIGAQVRLCPQDMENKAQWWLINDFASMMQRTQKTMSGLSYDDDDD